MALEDLNINYDSNHMKGTIAVIVAIIVVVLIGLLFLSGMMKVQVNGLEYGYVDENGSFGRGAYGCQTLQGQMVCEKENHKFQVREYWVWTGDDNE